MVPSPLSDRILIVCIALIFHHRAPHHDHMCSSSQSIGSENLHKLLQPSRPLFSGAIRNIAARATVNYRTWDLKASYWLLMPCQPYHWLQVSNPPSLRNTWRVFLDRCYIIQSFRVMALEIHTSISFCSPQGLYRGHATRTNHPKLTRQSNIETQDCESLKCQASFILL